MTDTLAEVAKSARRTRLPVMLAHITRHNWQKVIHLQLDEHQVDRLASNLYSLAEAYVESECQPRAIYAGKTVIGFVMYEYEAHSGVYSIPRFMIDRAWQGRGYGGASLQAVIDALKTERPDAPIFISVTPDNIAARRFYKRLGFVDIKRRSHGEDLLRHP